MPLDSTSHSGPHLPRCAAGFSFVIVNRARVRSRSPVGSIRYGIALHDVLRVSGIVFLNAEFGVPLPLVELEHLVLERVEECVARAAAHSLCFRSFQESQSDPATAV